MSDNAHEYAVGDEVAVTTTGVVDEVQDGLVHVGNLETWYEPAEIRPATPGPDALAERVRELEAALEDERLVEIQKCVAQGWDALSPDMWFQTACILFEIIDSLNRTAPKEIQQPEYTDEPPIGESEPRF